MEALSLSPSWDTHRQTGMSEREVFCHVAFGRQYGANDISLSGANDISAPKCDHSDGYGR